LDDAVRCNRFVIRWGAKIKTLSPGKKAGKFSSKVLPAALSAAGKHIHDISKNKKRFAQRNHICLGACPFGWIRTIYSSPAT
jgi:hypothetical protein